MSDQNAGADTPGEASTDQGATEPGASEARADGLTYYVLAHYGHLATEHERAVLNHLTGLYLS